MHVNIKFNDAIKVQFLVKDKIDVSRLNVHCNIIVKTCYILKEKLIKQLQNNFLLLLYLFTLYIKLNSLTKLLGHFYILKFYWVSKKNLL